MRSTLPSARTYRIPLRLLQAGSLAVILVVLPYKRFDLDRFFVPKELALHAVAAVTALLCLRQVRRLSLTGVDTFLAGFLALSAISALAAPNWWLAARALGVSISGIALFWVSRDLARARLARPLLAALVLAVVIGACTALLQAYGVESRFVSLNRAPGGTFGNRNFMAHVAAIGMPALLLLGLDARRRLTFALCAAGLALLSAAFVLSRSRAAWLALMVCAVPLVIAAWRTRRRWYDARTGSRLRRMAIAAAVGIATAITLPNTLDWRSDSPYLDSMRDVMNYREGSGRGRLVQYRTSLRMVAAHPLLGAGTGNWSVVYPRFAGRHDPSISRRDGMTANPWPSSDWVTMLSERGGPAALLLLLALAGLAVDAVRQIRRARNRTQLLTGLAAGATLIVIVVVGAFDAVVLLPASSLVVWSLLGALHAAPDRRRVLHVPLSARGRRWMMMSVGACGVLLAARSARQAAAMSIASASPRTAALERAARTDPGSYRLHITLAESYARRGKCAGVREHAGDARALYPHAPEPRQLLAECRREARNR